MKTVERLVISFFLTLIFYIGIYGIHTKLEGTTNYPLLDQAFDSIQSFLISWPLDAINFIGLIQLENWNSFTHSQQILMLKSSLLSSVLITSIIIFFIYRSFANVEKSTSS